MLVDVGKVYPPPAPRPSSVHPQVLVEVQGATER